MKRILFVDDEPEVLQALRVSLYARRKEWEIHLARGGEEGRALLATHNFDVLVTDLRMPGLDGTALIAQARCDSPSTVRIVLSGYADEDRSAQLLSLAHRYLSKPCEHTRLEQCIDRCLATQSLIQSERVRARLGTIGALPSMPATFAALQKVLADPKADSNRIASVILKDPAISAKVLQVCNSAFFRLPKRITKIQQAVSYLGLVTVRSIVLAAELFNSGDPLPVAMDMAQLQRHALNVAAIARELAAQAPWAEEAFLAGLLHDVGLLLLGRQFGPETQLALDAVSSGMSLAQAEERHIGIDHATAGAYLLSLWGLPYEIVEAVAYHEEPTRVRQNDFDALSAVALAQALLAEIRPSEMPFYESRLGTLTAEDWRRVALPAPWPALRERAAAVLEAGRGK
jgi:HD-like signal output (HDOD) protein